MGITKYINKESRFFSRCLFVLTYPALILSLANAQEMLVTLSALFALTTLGAVLAAPPTLVSASSKRHGYQPGFNGGGGNAWVLTER
jgi:hypothetical protein